MRYFGVIMVLVAMICTTESAFAIKMIDSHTKLFKDVVKQSNNNIVPDITYYDLAGKPHNLKEQRGKVILLHFWATWCPPCIQELPSLNSFEQRMKEMAAIGDIERQAITVIPISMDYKNYSQVRDFYVQRKLQALPLFFDKSNAAFAALGVKNLPTTIIIGPRGREIGRVEANYQWNTPDVQTYLLKHSEVQPK